MVKISARPRSPPCGSGGKPSLQIRLQTGRRSSGNMHRPPPRPPIHRSINKTHPGRHILDGIRRPPAIQGNSRRKHPLCYSRRAPGAMPGTGPNQRPTKQTANRAPPLATRRPFFPQNALPSHRKRAKAAAPALLFCKRRKSCHTLPKKRSSKKARKAC